MTARSSAVGRGAARGLILDFGGVVTTDFYDALRGFCVREGLPADAMETVMRDQSRGREALALAERGQIPQREFEVTVADLLGVHADDLFVRILIGLRPRVEVLDLVDQAREAGIATAVLSNSWGAGVVDPYAGYDLDVRFDTVVISDQVGLRKPDPTIYQLTADRLGLAPHECVFVDDTAHNLPPAAALGMATVLFADVETGIPEIKDLLVTT